MKRKLSLAVVLVLAISAIAGCSSTSSSSSKTYTVGIAQIAEHPALDSVREGFKAGLKAAGYEEGKNLKVLEENAQGDTSIAAQISTDFVSKKVDLICAIATQMAQSAVSATKGTDIPVIFSAVTDPIAAELAKADGTPNGSVTGISDALPPAKQLEMIRQVLPDAKKIGILYNTSEVNSISQLKEYQTAAANYGFEIVESGVTAAADIPLATDNLLQKVDCLNNLTDNTIVSSLAVILDKANAKKIPVFGSESSQVEAGCLASVGIDYYELGVQTGTMAAKVLSGEKKASEINFEKVSDVAFYGNSEAAKKLGITLPESLVNSAKVMYPTTTK